MLSCFSKRKVRHGIAMTGEISLRGRILPVGGIREKITAAKRMNITTAIMPKANKPDLEKVPEMVKSGIHFIFAEHFEDIVGKVLS
ncbi:MAG: S16 family serine protease [Candidatus Marinimicrobia bacterium]|nr:S16 family serine protease [Candidatus Neomarinimicrobiota bacterium]